jgi:hypothetical protein
MGWKGEPSDPMRKPAKGIKTAYARQLLLLEAPPFPLSSRAQPRDLRFSGVVVEMFFNSVQLFSLIFFGLNGPLLP